MLGWASSRPLRLAQLGFARLVAPRSLQGCFRASVRAVLALQLPPVPAMLGGAQPFGSQHVWGRLRARGTQRFRCPVEAAALQPASPIEL